jgi:hypothetical protein
MLMTILASSDEKKERIESSLERILNSSADELKMEIEQHQILVCDDLNADGIYTDSLNLFKRAYSEGFGGIKGNITYQGSRFHLVVLNITNIDNFVLNDEEFDGVFSHELGHIFNENPQREVPSILKGNNKKEIDDAKLLALKEAEFYADYFSKRTGTSSGLISSMHKYLASPNSLHRDMFDERLRMLNSDKVLIGTTKPVR